MADQLPFAYWQSDAVIGEFLTHNMADLNFNANVPFGQRALIFWGDNTHTRISSTGQYIGANATHIYDASNYGHFNTIKYTPENKISHIEVTTQFVSGQHQEYIATVDFTKEKNLKSVYFSNVPFNNITLNNVLHLDSLYVSYFASGNIKKLSSIDLEGGENLDSFGLGHTSIKDIDISHNPKLRLFESYTNEISACIEPTSNSNLHLFSIYSNGVQFTTSKYPNLISLKTYYNIDTTNYNFTNNLFFCELSFQLENFSSQRNFTGFMSTINFGNNPSHYAPTNLTLELKNGSINESTTSFASIAGQISGINLSDTYWNNILFWENGNSIFSNLIVFWMRASQSPQNSPTLPGNISLAILAASESNMNNGIMGLGDTVYDDAVVHPITSVTYSIAERINYLQTVKNWYITGNLVSQYGIFETFNSDNDSQGLIVYDYTGASYPNEFSTTYREQRILYTWSIDSSTSFFRAYGSDVLYLSDVNPVFMPSAVVNNIIYKYYRMFTDESIFGEQRSFIEVYNNGVIVTSGLLSDLSSITLPYDTGLDIISNTGNCIIVYVGYTSSQNAPAPGP